MKKSLVFAFSIVAVAVLSCVSKPPPPPPPPARPPQQADKPAAPQVSTEELNAARARADEARKRALDFEGDAYFPGEWEAAEAQYAQVAGSAANPETSAAACNAAADAYDSIFNMAIPLYAQAREDEIMGYRSSLISAGARDSFPEYFPPAEEAALLALNQYEEKDFYGARDSAARSLQMFQIMATAYDAWMLRQEIKERDFILYDSENYERGGEMISDAMDAYNAGNLPLAMENAKEALSCNEAVLSVGWASYAELRGQLAEGERLAALDSKTNIAEKVYFSAADSDYEAAQELFKAERYEEAAKRFVGAEAMFVIASMSASEKQSLANTAIREAHEKIEESEENARQAEITIEGAPQ